MNGHAVEIKNCQLCTVTVIYMYSYLLSGNAVLLIIFAVMGHDTNRSTRGGLALFNILQIIFTIEFMLCVPAILWYLGTDCILLRIIVHH